MKKAVVQDERVLTQKYRVLGEAYTILMCVLGISIFVQAYLFGAPFKQYAVEFICFIGICVYVLARNLKLGIDLYASAKSSKRLIIVNSLVSGMAVATISSILNYIRYTENYTNFAIADFAIMCGITFASAFAASFIVIYILTKLNEQQQQRVQQKLDNEENE